MKEEMRRAALHLEGVVIRSAHTLYNAGQKGYTLTLVEALILLRNKNVAKSLLGEADALIVTLNGARLSGENRLVDVLTDVVRVANSLDALCIEREFGNPPG